MTTQNSKPFSQKLYDENDSPAALKLQELFKNTEYTIRRPENKYIVDFEILKAGALVGYLETEIKLGWSGREYPFPDVRFPKRKEKFTKLNKPTYFVMFNKDLSRHLMVSGKVLTASPTTRVSNKYVKDEPFYCVALSDIKWDRFNFLDKIV